ncbi:MAG: phosphoglucomutase/phosphomannomutase family protein [Nitrospirales bacterium]|nr:phosphoglucomutase/phosphomannomutase family protein [Nitrospira sp.]MDR4500741.1 phosphoglucomutase/phosphomannomutase family protein [Nitrospirales bacterium]
MESIKFGTSGWRAIVADEFTFRNVRIVCQGIAQYLRQEKIGQRGVIIGYDTRFMGERFAKVAGEVMSAHGIPSLLCDRDTPTPTISYHILHRKLAGGINISASHNPPDYNGVKFTPSWGGPALPETTKAIEQRIIPLLHGEYIKWLPWERAKADGMIRFLDPKPEYLKGLEAHVDSDKIRGRGLRIIMDPLFGTTREYLDEFLRQAGCKLALLHHWRDPYFGGLRPEPAQDTLRELQEAVRREGAHIGLATDGDGDRFGVVDADGTFIEPNLVLALLLDHLIQTRKWTGWVARSVATTHLVDAVASHHGLSVHETPVGFKYIGELLAKGEVVMGGEESAGLSIQGHVPEKDGILACALVVEMVAHTGKTLKALLVDLFERVGTIYSAREDIAVDEAVRESLNKIIDDPPETFAGSAVSQVNRLDGCKLLLADGSWFLLRPSGTEPIVRCYSEATTEERVGQIVEAGRKLLNI